MKKLILFSLLFITFSVSSQQILFEKLRCIDVTSTVEPPVESSNLILNSTFDDATNLTLDSSLTVSEGTLNFDDSANGDAVFALRENIVSGSTYNVSVEQLGGSPARISLYASNGTTEWLILAQALRYYDQTLTASYTHTGVDATQFILRADKDAGGTTFGIDNVIVEEVILVPLQSVSISFPPAEVQVGLTEQLSVVFNPTNADDTTGIWSSSNANVTIDQTGLVTGVIEGSSIITYTSTDGPSDTTTINVVPFVPILSESVSLPPSATITVGRMVQLAPIFTPANTTDQSGNWTSSTPANATVTADSGLVTAVAEGYTTITFTSTDGGFISTTNLEITAIEETLKAFPTALGSGAYSRSDEPYEIYEVTNLNSLGAGSLWEGMRQSNTIVVFRVSGIISMNEPSQTSISNSVSNNIILGQTAPYPGITVVGNGFKYTNGTNIITRYIRFRQWRCRAVLHDPCSYDVIDHLDFTNMIYDHCSFAFGGDESLSTRFASHNFTLQNSIVSYGLSGGLFGDSADYTLGYNYSSIGNLWHTVGKRTPNPNGNGRFDILGNVTYNILNLAMRTGGDVQLNEIGNYYRYTLRSHIDTAQNPNIFTENNRSNQYNLTADNQDNEVIWQDRVGNTGALIAQYFTPTIHPLMNYDIPLINGDEAYIRVTNREMGANAYLDNNGNAATYIDDLDIEAYNEFDNDTRFSWTDPDGLVTTDPTNRTQVNYRVIPQRQWLLDNEPNFGVIVNTHSQTTHTGVVPNTWITSKGLVPATFNPLGYDLSANHTNIEIYSFGIDF